MLSVILIGLGRKPRTRCACAGEAKRPPRRTSQGAWLDDRATDEALHQSCT